MRARKSASTRSREGTINLFSFLNKQRRWSFETFGRGQRTEGNLAHIESEMREVRENPTDLTEWVDIALLALDGAMRAGHSPYAVCQELTRKLDVNIARAWPKDVGDGTRPVEHLRGADVCAKCGNHADYCQRRCAACFLAETHAEEESQQAWEEFQSRRDAEHEDER